VSATTTAFGALRHRNFQLFIFGQFVSLCGTWMQGVALGWLVLTLTDSAFAVGLVSAMGALPVLLFTLQGGALADRVNRHRALTLLQTGMLVEALVLAVLAQTHHATLPWIIVLALVSGLLSAFEIPVRQSFLMDLVGRENLMNAIAMNSMAFNVSRVVGPALAGILVAAAGPPVAFFVNAASYLAVIGALLAITPDPSLIVPRRTPPPLAEALRYILAPGWPRTLVTLSTIYTIFGLSFLTVLPVYARDVVGTGAAGFGGLTSAFGLGAAAGALTLAAWGARYRRGVFALRGGLVIGASLVLAAAFPRYPIAFGLLLLGGAAAAISAIVTNTLLQTEAPEHLRGRVIGFYSFIVVGLAPLGSLQAGWVGQHLGVRVEAAIGGGMCLLTALWMLRRARHFTRPPGEERRHQEAAETYKWGERRHL
jgi:MFS family permease